MDIFSNIKSKFVWAKLILYCEFLFICWTFNFMHFLGKTIQRFKILTKCWFHLIVVCLIYKSTNSSVQMPPLYLRNPSPSSLRSSLYLSRMLYFVSLWSNMPSSAGGFRCISKPATMCVISNMGIFNNIFQQSNIFRTYVQTYIKCI